MGKKKKRTTRQHLLPRSYLKRFANSEQVYVHNFHSGQTYINNITDATCIDDFYTVQTQERKLDDCIEEFLGKIEGISDLVIEETVNTKCVPTGNNKAVLCNYLALMYTRGLWFRQIYLEVYEHFAIDMFDELMSNEKLYNETMGKIKEIYGAENDLPFEEAAKIRQHFNVGVDIPRTFYVKEMMIHAAMLVDIFYSFNFNLLYIPVWSSIKYITSDRPFVPMTNSIEKRRWIEDPDAEIYFPLSSDLCLMMNRRETPIVRKVEREEVAFFNFHVSNESVFLSVSQEKDFVWRYDDKRIYHSSEKLVEMLSKGKKIRHRASESSMTKMKSTPKGDVNLLKGKDE